MIKTALHIGKYSNDIQLLNAKLKSFYEFKMNKFHIQNDLILKIASRQANKIDLESRFLHFFGYDSPAKRFIQPKEKFGFHARSCQVYKLKPLQKTKNKVPKSFLNLDMLLCFCRVKPGKFSKAIVNPEAQSILNRQFLTIHPETKKGLD